MASVMSKENADSGSGFVSQVAATKSGKGDDNDQEEEGEGKSKSKRKRKRKRSEKSGEKESEGKSIKKSNPSGSSSFGVDSIVNVISLPKENQ